MTDRPIIFTAPMIRALLDGRKTQTRRVLKRQPPDGLDAGFLRIEGAPFARLTHGRVILRDRFPYEVGDRLWVRETFSTPALMELQYRADPPVRCGHWVSENGRWTPSIHMPRWASRLTLAVTDVRVQRLNDISRTDAIAEGCDGTPGHDTVCDFSELWEVLHGPGSWSANPWVVAITFTVHRCNIDAMEKAA